MELHGSRWHALANWVNLGCLGMISSLVNLMLAATKSDGLGKLNDSGWSPEREGVLKSVGKQAEGGKHR